MNKFLTILSLLMLLTVSVSWAQSFGGFNSDDQEELPIAQPTPAVDVPPPPMDFGQDNGSGDFSDYSGTDN